MNVIEMISKVELSSPWIEYGDMVISDQLWTSVTTTLTSYRQPIVVLSLPSNPTNNAPFIPRIKNFHRTGRVTFQTRLFQPNDSYCSKQWHIPRSLGNEVQIKWLVAERGAYNISNKYFFVHEANISRPYADPKLSIMDIDYPKGCISLTTSCRYWRNSVVGVIAQLQSLVYERMLIPRLAGALYAYAKFILQPHDSLESTYLVLTSPELLGFITFNLDQEFLCSENIILSTYGPFTTNIPSTLAFQTTYQTSPGIFGMLGSTIGLADSTSIRLLSVSKSNATLLCQEDQCADEEVVHSNTETAFLLVIGEYMRPQLQASNWLECGIYFSPELYYPTPTPSLSPSLLPSVLPTKFPTVKPSYSPSVSPTISPSVSPTISPSVSPTISPSSMPTQTPTFFPTVIPSCRPSCFPTTSPSSSPSIFPSHDPTFRPSTAPTSLPSFPPSLNPSSLPTQLPSTCSPSLLPTVPPTPLPTLFPSSLPSHSPTSFPTLLPTREDKIGYYNSIDVQQLLRSSPISGPLQFSFAVTKYSDFKEVSLQWADFIKNYLVTPFEVNYIAVELWTISILPGDSYLREVRTSCKDSAKVNSLITQITSQTSSEYSVNCSDPSEPWKSSSGKFCFGCLNLKTDCSTLDGKVTIWPNNLECYKNNQFFEGKLVSVLVIQPKLKNKESLPQISLIQITPSQSSAVATIFLSTSPKLTGNLFCNYFSTISDRAVLKTNVKKYGLKAQLGGSSTVTLTFSELLPSSTYDMYCFTEDLYGNTLSIADFLSTKTSFQTLCCLDIIVTGPKYLLFSVVDVSLNNRFHVNLQTLPTSSLKYNIYLRPNIFVNGNPSSDFIIQPSVFNFNYQKSYLGPSRSFLVVPLRYNCCNLTYTLQFTISGDDNSMYTPTSNSSAFTVVNSLEASLLIPPPSLTSAIFHPTGKHVDVCFGSNTDRGISIIPDNNLSWSCALIFTFPGDKYSTCTWVTSKCLQIHFCRDNLCETSPYNQLRLLSPYDSLLIRQQSVRSSCELIADTSECVSSDYSPPHSIVVEPPKIPFAFSPIIKILQHPGGECDSDLILDATSTIGNGGRSWNVIKWSVEINQTLPQFTIEFSRLQRFIKGYADETLVIPFSLLFPSHLTFTLELVNYLGVRGIGNIDISSGGENSASLSHYSLKLEGSSTRFIRSYEFFDVSASLSVPPCYIYTEVNLTYEWRIYKDSFYQPHLKSNSANPSVLLLPPYTLESGSEYSIFAFATVIYKGEIIVINASMVVQVDVGSVFISIKGGRRRHVARGSTQQLDASLSTHTDFVGVLSPIALNWSCSVSSASSFSDVNYGDSCDQIFLTTVSNVSSLHIVPLNTSMMLPLIEYTVTVSWFSEFEEIIFSVYEVFPSQPIVEARIDSNFKKFISSKILNLDGSVTIVSREMETYHNYSMLVRWEVFDSLGKFIDTSNLAVTPQSAKFSLRNETTIYFPMSLRHPEILVSGNSYNFKLTSKLLSPENLMSDLSFAEITLKSNGPPSNGLLRIIPSEGLSFVTSFVFNALYFIDDEDDYPLSYVFKHSLYPIAERNYQIYSSVFLSSQISDSNIASLLPSGLSSFNYQLTGIVIVSDFYSASIVKYCPVTVFNHSNSSRRDPLEKINSAKSQLNFNSLFQTVGNLGAYSLEKSCRSSPNCTNLNRLPCFSVPDTCGSCLPGYSGAFGDDNSLCVKGIGVDTKIINELCAHDAECFPNICKDGHCVSRVKSCPFNPLDGQVCSGHGKCALRDGVTGSLTLVSVGESLNCTVTDTNCFPICVCIDSYYGYRCGLTAEENYEISVMKTTMCDTLSYILAYLDDSEEKLQLLVSSLSATVGIDTNDVTTLYSHCLPILKVITNVTNAGFLSLDSFPHPHHSILRVLSQFTRTISRQGSFPNSSSYDPIRASIDSLVNSISRSLVGGEIPMDLSSEEWRVSVQKSRIDNFQNMQFAPSANDLETVYNLSPPSVRLPESGLSTCFSPDNFPTNPRDQYLTLSLVEWGENPIMLDPNNVSLISASRMIRLSVRGPTAITNYSSRPNENYFLTLRWTSGRPFHIDQLRAACPTVVNGYLSEDSECPCEVVAVTSDRVTYSCKDLYTLCPSEMTEIQPFQVQHSLDYPIYHSATRRRLDFDYDASADDDNQKQTAEIKEYIATLKSIKSELTQTLSNTQFPISRVVPLLTALSIFLFLCASGALLFSYWDEYDSQLLEAGHSLSLPADQRCMNKNGKRSFDLSAVFMGTSFVKEKEAVALNHLRHMNSFQEEKGNVSKHTMNQVNAGDRLKPIYRLDGYFANVDDLEYDEAGTSYDETIRPVSVSLNSVRSLRNIKSPTLDDNDAILEQNEKKIQHEKMISLSARLKLSETMAASDSSSESSGDGSSIHSISTFRSDILPPPKMKDRSQRRSPPPIFVKPPLERSTSSSTARTMTTGSKLNPFVRSAPLIRKLSSIGTVDSIVSATGVKIFEIGSQLSSFFDRALPPTSLLSEKNGWRRFLQSVLREHDWLRIVSYSSRRLPRIIRYFVVITNLLILFFVDSLFYGIFYPGNEICERYSGTDELTCLSVPSKLMAQDSQCSWSNLTQKCEMKTPPSSLQFYMIVSIIVTCMSILPQVLCTTILEEVCACSPVFDASLDERQHDQPENNPKNIKKRSSTLGKTIRKYDIFNNNLALSEVIDVYNYYEHLSCEEETNMILTSVDVVLQSTLQKISLPWRVEYLMDDQPIHIEALTEYLGIYPDGSPVPLTILQKMFYGSTRKRIEWKINKVRKQSQSIVANLMRYTDDDEDCIDTALIQYFILEHLSPFNRYALKKEFFRFDNALPEEISYFTWLSGWIFMICFWLFLVYYIFQWALVHSFLTVTSWSFQIMFVLIQDIFVNQLLQIFLIHVVIIEALRPKLRQIYFILNDIVVNKIQQKGSKTTKEEKFHFVRVCQHLSACCRAARVESLKYLPASQLLMRIDDHDVALCRDKGRGIKIGWIMSVLIVIPTLLALADDTIQESVLDIALPTAWSCFLLANTYLYQMSPVALTIPYLLLLCALLYRYFIVLPHRRARLNNKERSQGSLSLFDQGILFLTTLWIRLSGVITKEAKMVMQWRNMNLSFQLREPNVTSKLQELKRLRSDLSEVLHEASVRSSRSFRNINSNKIDPSRNQLSFLNIPPQIMQLRNMKKQQKFIYRLDKGKNWRSRWINYLFWNLNSQSPSNLNSFESVTEGNIPSMSTEAITSSSNKSERSDEETKEWLYYQCDTDANNIEDEELVEDGCESDVFTSVKSTSSDSSEDSWGGLYFDHYYDVDDSTNAKSKDR